jgi:hypothetical protein
MCCRSETSTNRITTQTDGEENALDITACVGLAHLHQILDQGILCCPASAIASAQPAMRGHSFGHSMVTTPAEGYHGKWVYQSLVARLRIPYYSTW